MQLFYSDTFVLPLPPGHRFPMEKYARLRQTLLDEGYPPADFILPEGASREDLCRAHDPAYVERVCSGQLTPEEMRQIGFPWSDAMVERSRRSAGATLGACRAALAEGWGVNLAGGTHHAAHAAGAGFCVFNDAAVAARALQAQDGVGQVAVIDCDVHQGDGTARILEGDASVFTFSIHGARNYPFAKARSDLDIELPDGCDDAAYLAALEQGLADLFSRCRPQLAIYLAGADPYAGDRLGRLSLTMAGLEARDERVLAACRERGIPVAIAMAGGYARDIGDTVAIHANTIRCARRHFEQR